MPLNTSPHTLQFTKLPISFIRTFQYQYAQRSVEVPIFKQIANRTIVSVHAVACVIFLIAIPFMLASFQAPLLFGSD